MMATAFGDVRYMYEPTWSETSLFRQITKYLYLVENNMSDERVAKE